MLTFHFIISLFKINIEERDNKTIISAKSDRDVIGSELSLSFELNANPVLTLFYNVAYVKAFGYSAVIF